MPEFDYGMRANPNFLKRANPNVRGDRDAIGHSVVSFFAGCGGLDLGALGGFEFHGKYYEPQPFNIVAAYDNDPKAVEAYKLNIADHAHLADLTQVDMAAIPAADVLFGGFPCQDFSSCGHKQGFSGPRGMLYQKMVDYMRLHRPKVVVGENVPLLKGMIYML